MRCRRAGHEHGSHGRRREPGGDGCTAIPIQQSLYTALTDALSAAAPDQAANGGLGNHMWGTIVDRFGVAAQ